MDILEMSALELATRIQSGDITVRQAVYAYKEQLHKMEPMLNSFVSVIDEVLEARIDEVQLGIQQEKYTIWQKGEDRFDCADADFPKGNCIRKSLAGVPIVIKDNICTKGVRTTCGSKMLENFVPSYNAEVVDRLEKAGMIILGKTNLDEFAMGSTTETSYFGATKNPWNTGHVAGGSSGGSCAAVAAGQAPLALGSDTGGSIRQPAAYCGVVGLKPTYGRVSRYGLVAYVSSLDQIGPIGRTVADCAALYHVIAGYDEKDGTSIKTEGKMTSVDIASQAGGFCQSGEFAQDLEDEIADREDTFNWKKVRIGIPTEYLNQITQPEVKNAIEHLAQLMREQGATVEEFSLGLTDYAVPAYYIIACAEASSNLARFDGVKYGYRATEADNLADLYKKSRTEGFGEEAKCRIMLGTFSLSSGYYDDYYLKALKAKTLLTEEIDKVLEQYDFILAPVSPNTAPAVNTSLGEPLKMYKSDIFTVTANLTGLPALSMPARLDAQGLPIGVQFMGRRMGEEELFQLGEAVEKLRGEFRLPFQK